MFEPSCAIPVDRPRGAGYWACAALLSLSLFTTGCLFQKKRAQVRPWLDPTPPRPVNTANLKPPPTYAPPDMVLATVDIPQELALNGSSITELAPPPPAPPPRGPRPSPPKPPVATTAPPAETSPAPRLGQLATPDQQRENNRILDETLSQVQNALEALAKKNLNADQKDKVAQIRELQTQARQAKVEDIAAAIGFAKHADSLAKDLLGRLP